MQKHELLMSSILRTHDSTEVNLCQKLSFLNQLTHNMTRDCSLNYKKNTSSEHLVHKNCLCFDIKNNNCTQHVLNLYFSGDSMNNLLSYCGLADSKMRASEDDLPVPKTWAGK